ncbi:hypothetical protein [Saccharothrix yanglingensis]|uniref:hypothetical protein n=1 Tax=Saccharothrix yanglingensis TaxID=659496 RepID=UPI0027D25C2A|nr:hypothetical protein [Saccharothrix yanglingensis]
MRPAVRPITAPASPCDLRAWWRRLASVKPSWSRSTVCRVGPDDRFCFSLEEVEIAAFRAAPDAAIARAEADLAAGPLDNPRAEAVRVSR